jgi:NAD(P)-dependent dehydrogenase (short-subunit alcohol dehydrogenase family)
VGDRRAAGTPVGRIGHPDDVASAIVYLAGNGFVTGTVLDVSGGLTLARG